MIEGYMFSLPPNAIVWGTPTFFRIGRSPEIPFKTHKMLTNAPIAGLFRIRGVCGANVQLFQGAEPFDAFDLRNGKAPPYHSVTVEPGQLIEALLEYTGEIPHRAIRGESFEFYFTFTGFASTEEAVTAKRKRGR